MREFKFRGKRIDNGEWVYGLYFITPLTDENSGASHECGWFFLSGEKRHCISDENGCVFVVDEKTVGQYTGLRGKNGKEIYEGDILDYGDSWGKRKVEFQNGCFVAVSEKSSHWDIKVSTSNFELIGNIHEYLELLK